VRDGSVTSTEKVLPALCGYSVVTVVRAACLDYSADSAPLRIGIQLLEVWPRDQTSRERRLRWRASASLRNVASGARARRADGDSSSSRHRERRDPSVERRVESSRGFRRILHRRIGVASRSRSVFPARERAESSRGALF